MVTSPGLILVSLVMHFAEIDGGDTRKFVGPTSTYCPYLVVLAIRTILSIVSVPIVLYALILGVTRSKREFWAETPYRKVSHITADAWLVSLALGVVAYLPFNHVYSWKHMVTAVESAGAPLVPVVGV